MMRVSQLDSLCGPFGKPKPKAEAEALLGNERGKAET
jgi:hypothetical protein